MERTLFSCLYGSHLFGTHTAQSDRDEKHIVLPALDSLLIGIALRTRVEKTNTLANTRNTKEDVDQEFIPLQVFARDFVDGQTYALELAFALDGTHAEQQAEAEFRVFCSELRTRSLTGNVRAIMGYAVNQANLYSFKGERLNALRAMMDALTHARRTHAGSSTLADVADDAAFFALATAYPKYFRRETYDIGGGRMRECFSLLEKTLPFTNTLDHTDEVLATLEKKYGARAKEASAANVDWKAFMHALRIVDQGIELLRTRALTFPRPPEQVAQYLRVRRGEIAIETLREELSEKIETLKTLEGETTPPPRAEFEAWLAQWMRRFYKLNGK
jgi:hypothetical protein